MTINKDDELLSALLDGELEDDTRMELELLMAKKPGAQARLDSFARVDDLLRASYADIQETPLPRIDTDAMMTSRRAWSRYISVPMAAAASIIMLLSGVLGGLMVDRFTRPDAQMIASNQTSSPGGAMTASVQFEEKLNKALESQSSGKAAVWTLTGMSEPAEFVINRTWKMKDGRYCREYDISANASGQREVGVACRNSEGNWRINMRTYPETPRDSI